MTREYVRAAPGGTGEAKCGGNYAGSLIAQAEAIRQGCDQVVFLDAVERRWVEELGGMNVFFVFDDGSVQTPPLDGTILHGITRDSLLTLARDMGVTVREEPLFDRAVEGGRESGRLTEAFACGTAAVVTPIGRVKGADGEFTIGGQSIGPLTLRLRSALVDIQRGDAPDPYGWVEQRRLDRFGEDRQVERSRLARTRSHARYDRRGRRRCWHGRRSSGRRG